MTTKPRLLSASSPAVMRTLVWMRKSGFKPVPLRAGSKAAVSRDYASIDYHPPDDDAWRQHQYELGVVLGPRHGGPLDVDLDCQEALYFAPRFLPQTDAVFGRPSKPRSHFLYRTDAHELDKKAYLDPTDNSTIVEIRADGGHQTVMPGSLHEGTGELIEWAGPPFPEVTTVSSEQLILAVRKVALASLIARHVWQPGYHNEPCKHLSGLFYYLEWPVEDTISLIQAVMEYSGDDDKSRIPTVRATYRRGEAGKRVSGAGVLRKQLKDDRVIDKILEWAGSPSVNVVQQYNDRFAVVSVEGKFRIADLDVSPGESPTFYQKDDFAGLMSTDFSDVTTDKGVAIPKFKLWLSSPRRRQYWSTDFVPGAEDTSFLNLWTGWAIQPLERYNGEADAWLELVRLVIAGGDDRLFNWLLHWFANMLREPADKAQTAPVIIGAEGAGKSLMLHYFGLILGQGYTVVTDEDHIYGKFNKHLASTLLLHSEEALYGGEKKHAGIIRSLITDKYRIFEQKGIDARRVRNFLRLVLTSNEAHAAPAKPGDRRYTVFDLGDRKIEATHLQRVLKEMDGDGPAGLHRYLLDMEYDPMIPRTNVKNDALIGMKSINMSPLEAWWHHALYEGVVLPSYLTWAVQAPEHEDKSWPAIVAGPALYASLCIFIKDRNLRGQVSDTLLALQLNRFVGHILARQRKYFDDPMLDNVPMMARLGTGRMSAIVNLPSLAECRVAFERYLGQKVVWPKEGDDGKLAETDQGPAY